MKDDNVRRKIINDLKNIHNDIVIVGTSLARLIGFHEDRLDYYYHVRYMNGDRYGKNEVFSSAVGGIESLKGKCDSYVYLDQVFALNGSGRSEEFLISKATEEQDNELYGPERDLRDFINN